MTICLGVMSPREARSWPWRRHSENMALSNYEIIGTKVRVPRLKRDSYLAALGEEGALPQNADSPWLTMFPIR